MRRAEFGQRALATVVQRLAGPLALSFVAPAAVVNLEDRVLHACSKLSGATDRKRPPGPHSHERMFAVKVAANRTQTGT